MGGVGRNSRAYRGQLARPPVDALIAEKAGRQHGPIAHEQLRALGLSPDAIQRRVTAGSLHSIYRGVYAVGHELLADKGRWMAAVLACGRGAVLSHREGAALWELRRSARLTIDVSSPGRRGRTINGIDAHRGDSLHPDDVTTVDEIPCTSVARTLLDLSEVVPRRDVERAIDQAEIRRRFDLRALEDVLARADGRRGGPILQAILADLRFGTTSHETSSKSGFWRSAPALRFRHRRSTPGWRSPTATRSAPTSSGLSSA